MKVVVQNGCEHVLSRKDVEAVLSKLPVRLSRVVNTIALCQGDISGLEFSFHKKEKTLELFSLRSLEPIEKGKAIELLVAGLLCVDDRGEWPERLSVSKRGAYITEAKRLLGGL